MLPWHYIACACLFKHLKKLRIRLVYLAKAPELALCMVIIPVVVGILRRKPHICHRFGDDRLGHDLYRERQFGDPRLPVAFVLQVKPG